MSQLSSPPLPRLPQFLQHRVIDDNNNAACLAPSWKALCELIEASRLCTWRAPSRMAPLPSRTAHPARLGKTPALHIWDTAKRKTEIRLGERKTRLCKTLAKQNLLCLVVPCIYGHPKCVAARTPWNESSTRSKLGVVFFCWAPLWLEFVANGATSHSFCIIHCVKWPLGGTTAYRTELARSGNTLATSCRGPSARAPAADGARPVHTGRRSMSLMTGQERNSSLKKGPAKFPGHT